MQRKIAIQRLISVFDPFQRELFSLGCFMNSNLLNSILYLSIHTSYTSYTVTGLTA